MSDIKIQYGITVDKPINNQWFIHVNHRNYQVIQIKNFKFIKNRCDRGHIKYRYSNRYSISENLEQITSPNSEPLKLFDGAVEVSVGLSTSKIHPEYKVWDEMKLIKIPKDELVEFLLSNQLSESFCAAILKLIT